MAWEQLQQFVWAPKTANGVYDGTSFNTYSSPLLVSNNEVSAISQLDNTNYHQTFNYSEVSRFSAITGLYNQSPSYGNYLAWIYKIGGGKLFLDYSTSEYLRIRFYVGDEYIELFSGAVQNSYSFSFGMLKDDTTQKGCITFATNNGSLCHAYIRNDSGTISISDLYNAIKNADKESTSEAGAGSGYIGNSLVSNKKMVGYNVHTSSAEATKTESVNDVSASAVSGKPKSGNGFAKVKFLRDISLANIEEYIPDASFGWTVTFDSNTRENHITGRGNEYWEYYECPVSVKKNTNYILSCQYKGSGMYYSTSNKDYLRIFNRFVAESEIRANNGLYGISGLTIIAESTDYFDSNSTYRDISVSFNSGNLTEVWICIGFGYGDYDANLFDVYFKDIQIVEGT